MLTGCFPKCTILPTPPSFELFPQFNANGGDGQFVYNVHRNFGVAFDLGAVTKGELNQTAIDTTVLNFVVGPRYTYRHHESRFQPFVQVCLEAPTRPRARTLIFWVAKSLLRRYFRQSS
jgi:hypothetical protein